MRRVAVAPDELVHVLRHLTYAPSPGVAYAEGVTGCGRTVYNSVEGLDTGWCVRPTGPKLRINCLSCLGRK